MSPVEASMMEEMEVLVAEISSTLVLEKKEILPVLVMYFWAEAAVANNAKTARRMILFMGLILNDGTLIEFEGSAHFRHHGVVIEASEKTLQHHLFLHKIG